MSQKVIITGASGAFGYLTTKSLLDAGYQVVGTMRSTKGKNEKVAAELQSLGAHVVEMDVTQESSVNQVVVQSLELLGGLDVVINNAGIGTLGLQELFSVEDMQKVFDVNLFGVQRLMRAVLPHLRAQKRGTILHVSSCIGRLAFPFYGVYSASKWALEAMAEAYRTDLAPMGIESVIVEPGGMPTAFMASLVKPNDPERAKEYGALAEAPEAALAGFEQALAANEMQRPEKVAEAIRDLLAKPYGEKPFRTVVDYMGMAEPVEAYNTLLHQITRGLYTNFGNESLLSLNAVD
ncbi:MAG: SDR family oxidoreductase [Bacteroidota bacterium]